MDTVFPFGFPFPTAFYLVCYVVTLMMHVAAMNYVLAGTGYVVFAGFLRLRRGETMPAMGETLRDWMPFALSAAITFGVAPLLFIQIVYPHRFYTANLLLFHRWMSILPVLIVGFYLLYLWKSRTVMDWRLSARAAVGIGAFACFAFTAYSWTENHVLSMQDQEAWSRFYATDHVAYWNPLILPRLAVWFIGAIPTMAALVSWQLWYKHRHGLGGEPADDAARSARVAIAGLLLAAACGLLYYQAADPGTRSQFIGPLAGGYFYAALAGWGLQLAGWLWQWHQRRLTTLPMVLVTAGMTLTIAGMTVVREAIRLSEVDITALYDDHAAAATKSGFWVFLACFVVCGGAIAASIVLIRRGLRRAAPVAA